MNKYISKIIVFILCYGIVIAFSATRPMYPFDSKEKTAQFQHLMLDLRCLVCQNQNLADSHAPLAEDLKLIIYDNVKAGKSDDEIIHFLTARYGDFILFNPPVKPITWLLWGAPFILCLIALVFYYSMVRSHDNK